MTRDTVALLCLLAFLVLMAGCVVEVNDSATTQKPAPTAAPTPEKIVNPVDNTPKRAWQPRKAPPVELPKEPEPAPLPPAPAPAPAPQPAPAPAPDANQTEAGLNGKPVPKEFSIDLAMWKYLPEQITVAEGDLVQLHLKSNSDGIGNGIGYKADGLPVDVVLKKGQTQTVEFTASQAGTYPVTCMTWICGPGNAGKTFGKILVVGGN